MGGRFSLAKHVCKREMSPIAEVSLIAIVLVFVPLV